MRPLPHENGPRPKPVRAEEYHWKELTTAVEPTVTRGSPLRHVKNGPPTWYDDWNLEVEPSSDHLMLSAMIHVREDPLIPDEVHYRTREWFFFGLCPRGRCGTSQGCSACNPVDLPSRYEPCWWVGSSDFGWRYAEPVEDFWHFVPSQFVRWAIQHELDFLRRYASRQTQPPANDGIPAAA